MKQIMAAMKPSRSLAACLHLLYFMSVLINIAAWTRALACAGDTQGWAMRGGGSSSQHRTSLGGSLLDRHPAADAHGLDKCRLLAYCHLLKVVFVDHGASLPATPTRKLSFAISQAMEAETRRDRREWVTGIMTKVSKSGSWF